MADDVRVEPVYHADDSRRPRRPVDGAVVWGTPGSPKCERLRDRSGSTKDGAAFKEAGYLAIRARVRRPAHGGTAFVDLVWQFSGSKGGAAFVTMLLSACRLVQAYSSLSEACAARPSRR